MSSQLLLFLPLFLLWSLLWDAVCGNGTCTSWLVCIHVYGLGTSLQVDFGQVIPVLLSVPLAMSVARVLCFHTFIRSLGLSAAKSSASVLKSRCWIHTSKWTCPCSSTSTLSLPATPTWQRYCRVLTDNFVRAWSKRIALITLWRLIDCSMGNVCLLALRRSKHTVFRCISTYCDPRVPEQSAVNVRFMWDVMCPF